MTGSRGIVGSAGRVTKKKLPAPMQLSVAMTGDRRLTENLILEVRALARRYGLEIPSIRIVTEPSAAPKVPKKAISRRRKAR